jgi:uncharacterized protein YcnI
VKRSLFLVLSVISAAIVAVAWQSPAFAHVEVAPTTAVAGATVDFVFTVPNESTTATTTQVQVVFPADHRPTSAATDPKTGWSITVDNSTGKIGSITWADGKIGVGALETFTATVALPNDTPTLKLAVLQTYSDGSVVRWIDDPKPDGSEAEHPAPILTLTGSVPPTSTTSTTTTSVATTVAPSDTSGHSGRWRGISLPDALLGIGACLGVIMYMRIRKVRARR